MSSPRAVCKVVQLIAAINDELRRLAKRYSGTEVLDCSSAVLANQLQPKGIAGRRLLLNASLIPDGVHPSYAGVAVREALASSES